MSNPRVVIVGAGFGGLSAAKALGGSAFDVTVIDQHNYHLFQPLLYQVATAGLSPADIASPIRGILPQSVAYKPFTLSGYTEYAASNTRALAANFVRFGIGSAAAP